MTGQGIRTARSRDIRKNRLPAAHPGACNALQVRRPGVTEVALPSLEWFNHLDADQARETLLACCASHRWAHDVAAGRPYPDLAALQTAADASLARLSWDGVREALAAHPRIGDRATGADREATWSRNEQVGVDTATSTTKADLVAANAAYEERFDHVFLICATGLPADHMLAEARRRLGNEPAAERQETVRELGKIVRLRLAKLVHP
jgi:2-oxo-4-hydroxy-4-carboxy-5-ureidoimidazoline decarboxylase